MTLLVPESLEPFGLWVEQLIAESTGKSGVGVVPIAGEPAGPASVYGPDRFFVRLGPNPSALDEATVAGAPHADIEFPEPAALGAEFVRWEIATAVAGAILGINPFDEPNVQQAKDATRTLLAAYTEERAPAHDVTGSNAGRRDDDRLERRRASGSRDEGCDGAPDAAAPARLLRSFSPILGRTTGSRASCAR